MGETVLKPEMNDVNEYFEHGNVRIIVKEHFHKEGKSFENIIEQSILRQARFDSKCMSPSSDGG